MTQIKRAVQALGQLPVEYEGGTWFLNNIYDDDEMEVWVRAVLQAIREPSEAMIARGLDEIDPLTPGILTRNDEAHQFWQAMIDAALAEGATK